MKQVPIDMAQTILPDLIARAAAGEEVQLTRDGTPVAKIVSIPQRPKVKRVPGRYRGVFEVGPEFFDPLPEDETRGLG